MTLNKYMKCDSYNLQKDGNCLALNPALHTCNVCYNRMKMKKWIFFSWLVCLDTVLTLFWNAVLSTNSFSMA